MECTRCKEKAIIKHGKRGEKQRYKCKVCSFVFVESDGRDRHKTKDKKIKAVELYTRGGCSQNFIAHYLGVSCQTIGRWLKAEAVKHELSDVKNDIKEIIFDEMWHFIGSKKRNVGLLKP